MLAAAFVSYAGPFNMNFRRQLVSEHWLPDLQERAIPITQGITPLDILANDTDKVINLWLVHECSFQTWHSGNMLAPMD